MSQIAQCTTIEEKQLVTKQNLDLLRRLYNGENATLEGTKYNLGDT